MKGSYQEAKDLTTRPLLSLITFEWWWGNGGGWVGGRGVGVVRAAKGSRVNSTISCEGLADEICCLKTLFLISQISASLVVYLRPKNS